MLSLLAFQTPPLSRELKPGTERHYRVEITGSAGKEFRYRIRTKIAPENKDGPQMDLTLTDYRASVEGHQVSVARAGGGLLPISATGLPKGISVSGPQGTLWLPLLAFYLPDTGGTFVIGGVPLTGSVTLGGKGEAKEAGRHIVMDASLSREGMVYGSLKIDTTLDDAGWPLKAEGTYLDASGTTRFTLVKG